MSQLSRTIKSNFVPFVVFILLVLGCCGAWFFFHPASPYHSRYKFVVRYEVVGTLSPGNRVEVRGISKGQILKVDLTDDAVFVTVEVLADARIAKNSEFRLINSGLMGEREMCILSGDGTDFVAEGDTVWGSFDDGTSGLSKSLAEIFSELSEMTDTLMSIKDSLTQGSTGKRIERVMDKGKNLVNTSGDMIGQWKSSVSGILDKCENTLKNAKDIVETLSQKTDKTVEDISALKGRTEELLQKVSELKDSANVICSKLEQEDNTAGLILSGKGRFLQEINRISKDIDALVADIKKQGVKLNVDIF